MERGVQLNNSLEEQLRLAGPDIRTIVEVGAADGRDTLIYAERCPNARIIAFEPLPENWAKLTAATESKPSIETLNLAVSDANGEAIFHVVALADASSLLKPRKTHPTHDKYTTEVSEIKVKTVRLDDALSTLGADNIDLLKIDAQGSELAILHGAHKLLESGRIKAVFCEVQFIALYEESALFHEITSYLSALGFNLFNVFGLVHNPAGQLAWADALYLYDAKNSAKNQILG
jgi:FkbM family methyltransferase